MVMDSEKLPMEGYRFEMYGNQYDITAVIGNNVRFSSIKGGKIYNKSIDDFMIQISQYEIKYIETPNYPLLDTDNYKIIIRKKRYIEEVLLLPHLFSNHDVQSVIDEVAHTINDQSPPSSRTVIRWVKKFITDESFLNEFTPNKGNHSLRCSPEIEAIIQHGIYEIFLKPKEFRSAKDVEAYIVSEFLNKGIRAKPPSIRTIQRRVKALDEYTVARNKSGTKTANQKYRAAGKEQNSPFLMNKIECDSHTLDVILLDDHTFEPIGRPTLICAIDVFSHCIVGWNLSMLPSNTTSTINLLKDMFTRPAMDLPGGIPASIVPDNGAEFKNNTLGSICENRKITILPSQKYDPGNKPHIENFFKTFTLSFSQKLKGTTFSNPSMRGEYNSKKHAGLTFSNLKYFINEWIECIYHQSPNEGIHNRIPIVLWKETVKKFPVLSMSKSEIDILARVPARRKINNGRIQFCYLTYYSHNLMNEHFNNKNVVILVDETNLERIYIRNPKDKDSFIIADSTNLSYTQNLSLYEHLCIQEEKKAIAEKDKFLLGQYVDLYARWKLYKKIQDTYAENKKLKKLKLRLPANIQDLLFNPKTIAPTDTQPTDLMGMSSTIESSSEEITLTSQRSPFDDYFSDSSSLREDSDDDYDSMNI